MVKSDLDLVMGHKRPDTAGDVYTHGISGMCQCHETAVAVKLVNARCVRGGVSLIK